MKTDLSVARLRELLHYNPETGVFTWRVKRKGVRADKIAGCINSEGYRVICLDGKLYLGQRLAWYYIYGEWPVNLVDHSSRDRANNSKSNLSDVTPSENNLNTKLSSNNKTGVKGVCWDKRKQLWLVQIQYKRVHKFIGYFKQFEDAVSARRQAEVTHFGEFRPSA